MTTATRTLSTVISANPYCDPLKDGRVTIPGIEMEQITVTPMIQAFRRMTRNLEFQICEVAVVTYFTARQYGVPITALPIFPLARFEHNGIILNANLVRTPKDLNGTTMGMRAYTVTPGIWARAFLQQEHGVDISSMRYVMGDDEHVIQYNQDPDIPKNLEYRMGADIQKLLADGEFASALHIPTGDYPHLKPLYPDGRAAGIAAYERMGGIYPLTHLMTIRNDVLAEYPWLPQAMMEAFKESKELHRKATGAPAPQHQYDDPMPIGLDETRKALKVLMDLSVEQHVMKKALDIDEMFPGNLN
jgi:4,5-dihydroxyphthalate decarboxylase